MNPNNMMQMLMNLQGSNGQINPQQIMNMFGDNPMMKQAQQMISSGGNPKDIINNIAKQKGIDMQQLQQMANMFGIKL